MSIGRQPSHGPSPKGMVATSKPGAFLPEANIAHLRPEFLLPDTLNFDSISRLVRYTRRHATNHAANLSLRAGNRQSTVDKPNTLVLDWAKSNLHASTGMIVDVGCGRGDI